MNKTPTPHIAAAYGEIASTVLMPGDPLRAKFVAETFLEDARLVSSVRGILAYTGTYKGTRLSVMASGMGIPSIGIYSYELYNFYDVENIIRIGTAGAITEKVDLRDIIIGIGASTNSNFASQYGMKGSFSATASWELLSAATSAASESNTKIRVGGLVSVDNFYDDDFDNTLAWARLGVLGVEMEAAGLYCTAARAGKRALAICSVSDNLLTGARLTVEERQSSLVEMITLGLDTAVKVDN